MSTDESSDLVRQILQRAGSGPATQAAAIEASTEVEEAVQVTAFVSRGVELLGDNRRSDVQADLSNVVNQLIAAMTSTEPKALHSEALDLLKEPSELEPDGLMESPPDTPANPSIQSDEIEWRGFHPMPTEPPDSARLYAQHILGFARYLAGLDNEISPVEAHALDQLRLSLRSNILAGSAKSGGAESSLVSLRSLNELTGLAGVKKEVRGIVEWARMEMVRRQRGQTNRRQMLHMALLGNPGTGKTTVARIIGEIYKEIGLLSKGHFVEVDRSKLVGRYVGQTAHLVNETVALAKGGVLFIDEAYSLSPTGGGGAQEAHVYEAEAVDTLVKLMEDERDDLVVILAGYTEPMRELLNSNPGLASRVPFLVSFQDYSIDELGEIFDGLLAARGLRIEAEARSSVLALIAPQINQEGFANGRMIRNLLEDMIRAQAVRLAQFGDFVTDEELASLVASDVPIAVPSVQVPRRRTIGFR
jgi:hypothetical protein